MKAPLNIKWCVSIEHFLLQMFSFSYTLFELGEDLSDSEEECVRIEQWDERFALQ